MSKRGYIFESEIEDFFLGLTNQKKSDPILKANKTGMIYLNRSFRIPTSGALDGMKGDILTAIPWLPKQFKVECKIRREKTKKEGRIFRLELDWVRKNNEEAEEDNQIPILTFAFKGDTTGNRVWWLLRNYDYDRLIMDFTQPHNILRGECKTGILNREEDKLKFVHSLLVAPTKILQEKFVWTLVIDDQQYYLLHQNQFYDLMVQLRDKKN